MPFEKLKRGELRSMSVNLDQWSDGHGEVDDTCSDGEGERYLQITNAANRDTEKQKQWGDKFAHVPCLRCEKQPEQCQRVPGRTGCTTCKESRQKCSRTKRYEAQQAAKYLDISPAKSWARYQQWGVGPRRSKTRDAERNDDSDSDYEESRRQKRKRTGSNSVTSNVQKSIKKPPFNQPQGISEKHAESPQFATRTGPMFGGSGDVSSRPKATNGSIVHSPGQNGEALLNLNKASTSWRTPFRSSPTSSSHSPSSIQRAETSNPALPRRTELESQRLVAARNRISALEEKVKTLQKINDSERAGKLESEAKLGALRECTEKFVHQISSIETILASDKNTVAGSPQLRIQQKLRTELLDFVRRKEELKSSMD